MKGDGGLRLESGMPPTNGLVPDFLGLCVDSDLRSNRDSLRKELRSVGSGTTVCGREVLSLSPSAPVEGSTGIRRGRF